MSEDLFSSGAGLFQKKEQPLAARMRPRSLDEFVGQDHILGPGRLLRRAIQADQLSSLIFYGPPGTGKTTLAWVIANTTRSHFITINAVLAGIKEIRAATAEAQERYRYHGQRTILFVDEVHRWNKAQQDALLPWVETGTVILIGATTENPFFEVNRPLVSRSRIFQLKPLSEEDLYTIARRTLNDEERGYGRYQVRIEEQALDHLVDVAGGDARTLLNALELAVETTPEKFPPPEDEPINITLEVAEESIQRRVVLYDKEGDYHFDTISAFIKSLRGSDPDAALYWLARMVYAGEDPRFLFRRMLILASEDVGLADPRALEVIEAAAAAFDRVGMPEGRFHLAQAALYLATAPKSNSIMGFFKALETVEKEREGEVPVHLKDASRDREGFGHGEGYLYPHAYREHWTAQQYLPDRLQGKIFYQPGDQGYEGRIAGEVIRRREAQLAAMLETGESRPEVLSFAGEKASVELWLKRTAFRTSGQLAEIRDRVLDVLGLARHHLFLDLAAGSGLLTWEALRRVPEGGVWSLVWSREEEDLLRQQAERLPELHRPRILLAAAEELPEQILFDAAAGRDVFLHNRIRVEGGVRLIKTASSLVKEGGKLSLAETLPGLGTRLSGCLQGSPLEAERLARLQRAEELMYRELGGLDQTELIRLCEQEGWKVGHSELSRYQTRRSLRREDLDRWFALEERGGRANFATYLLKEFDQKEVNSLKEIFTEQLAGREIDWESAVFFLLARRI